MANTTYPQSGTSSTQNAPLANLSQNGYSYSNFIYPLDLGTEGAGNDHYMIFHINQSGSTQFTSLNQAGQSTGAAPPTGSPTINQQAPSSGIVNGRMQSIPAPAGPPKVTSSTQSITRVATTIVLYMPTDIHTDYHADWDTAELGLADDLISTKNNQHISASDVYKSMGISALQNLGQMTQDFTGLSILNAASLKSRMAINPHKEVIFNGLGFRHFTFKFRFTPTSEAEAVNVDNIIRAFKFYASPEIDPAYAGRAWIYPAEFDIQYYSNGAENLFLNKISTCALTDININYTGVGHWAAFRPAASIQGNPSVCTELSLTFTELEIMQKQRILDGY